jgi:hydroxymethylpyrimidine pyrophosphatase-like HAD family hydrolase
VTMSVIALDYDGTIARGDVLGPDMREAIAAARRRGLVVVLVTGRILDDLRRVAGDLHFVDAVVAENGAVLHLPGGPRTSSLAPPVPVELLAELTRLGIPHRPGACLVDADAEYAPRLLDVIRRLELPLVLIFNRSRVMVTPQGVSKATGLRTALMTLRLSPRNTLAIGDAENDHELLRDAEVGMAVAWGCRSLQAAADLVVEGNGPPAVAALLQGLLAAGRLPQAPRSRRRLLLGHLDDGREFSLAVRGRNVLVTGDARSGKSWVAGLLCEQLILLGYSVCAIDPEGDYGSLEALPGVSVLGRGHAPPTPRELLHALRYPDRSLVIDLSHLPHDEKLRYVRATLPAVNVLRRRTGLPHRILLDEAHYYLHDADAPGLLDFEHHGYTVVTYQASRLPAALLAATEVMIVTCESSPVELAALRECCARQQPTSSADWQWLGSLKAGEAVALPMTAEANGVFQRFTLAPRITPHVRHREKYVDVPVSPDRGFVFTASGRAQRRAGTLREFVAGLEGLPAALIAAHAERGDFSRWIRSVYGDQALADELSRLEQRHAVDRGMEIAADLANAVRSRYDLLDDPPEA